MPPEIWCVKSRVLGRGAADVDRRRRLSTPDARPPSSRRRVDQRERRVGSPGPARGTTLISAALPSSESDRALDAGDAGGRLEPRDVALQRGLVGRLGDRAVDVDDDQQSARTRRARPAWWRARRRRGSRCPSGNWRSAPLPKSSESAGIASASRTPAASAAESAERFITAVVQRSQKLGVAAAAAPAWARRGGTAPPVNADDLAAARRRGGRAGDQRRQQRDGADDRDRDDDDRADRQRAHRGRVDQEQAGERDDHGHAGEDDGRAGGAHGGVERLLRGPCRRAAPRGSGESTNSGSPPRRRCRASR